MTRRRRILGILPPLMVGASAAGVAEISASLLLYSAEGFLPALTLILTVEAGALALGLWSGSVQVEASSVEQVRRRWLFVMMAFAMAAAFATGLTVMDGGLRGGLGQGFGLAFLGSLPLFALGSLLSSMARLSPSLPTGLSVPAMVGVAVGFLVSGWLLIPHLAPYTVYLLLLSFLSAAALLHGWVLDGGLQVEILEEVPTPRGTVVVEDQIYGSRESQWRIIREGGRIRGREDPEGRRGRPWEDAVLAALEGGHQDPGSALFLGGGSGTLGRLLLERLPDLRLVVVEESQEVVHLARKYFHDFPAWSRLRLVTGAPWACLSHLEGPFPLLLVDLAAVPTLGPVPDIPGGVQEELARMVGPRGMVVLGGLAHSGQMGEASVKALLDGGAPYFPRRALYEGAQEAFLLFSGPDAPVWSPALPGFHVTASSEEPEA